MISLIIPTYNIQACEIKPLQQMKDAPLISDIILADAGGLEALQGVEVVSCEKGRGGQLARGADAAQQDWLLFLHGDTVLEDAWPQEVQAFLHDPNAKEKAGYFRLKFDQDHKKAKRLEAMVAWRCRTFGLPYGDQGLLIHRSLYDHLGGFKPMSLMEDVDMVRRIEKERLHGFKTAAITSAAKYEHAGYLKRSLINLFCLGLYYMGVRPDTIAKVYGS